MLLQHRNEVMQLRILLNSLAIICRQLANDTAVHNVAKEEGTGSKRLTVISVYLKS